MSTIDIFCRKMYNNNIWRGAMNLAKCSKFSLPKVSELENKSSFSLMSAPSDLCLTLGGTHSFYRTTDGYYSSSYYVEDDKGGKDKVISVDSLGTILGTMSNSLDEGIKLRVSISVDQLNKELAESETSIFASKEEIAQLEVIKKDRARKGENYVMLAGLYPTDMVSYTFDLDDSVSKRRFSDAFYPTGRIYRYNGAKDSSQTFSTMLAPEYMYRGERVARFLVRKRADRINDDEIEYLSGTTIHDHIASQADPVYAWHKVMPIRHVILNADKLSSSLIEDGTGEAETIELVTENMITSNIPYQWDTTKKDVADYESSTIKKFIDILKEEAYNMDRAPMKEFAVPKSERFIKKYAYSGCMTLEKIRIHKGVEHIGIGAFNDLSDNIQIYIAAGMRHFHSNDQDRKLIVDDAMPLSLRKEMFEGTNLKYIYVSSDGQEVILSGKDDKKLNESHQKFDFSIEKANEALTGELKVNLDNCDK